MVAARSPWHPQRRAGLGRSAGQAAADSRSLVAHSAANTAGAFIPSDECGRRQFYADVLVMPMWVGITLWALLIGRLRSA
jgi:hypothetical protein